MDLKDIRNACLALEAHWLAPDRLEKIGEIRAMLKACRDPRIDNQKLAGIVVDTVTLPQFVSVTVALERVLGTSATDGDCINRPDSPRPKAETMPVGVILENIRSAFNVGSIFRSADGFGLEKVALTGYTATPDHPSVIKSALGTERHLNWSSYPRTALAIEEFRKLGHHIYAVETAPGGIPLPEFKPQFPCHVILGNERHGIDPETLKKVDGIITIPMAGTKQSLNVGVSAALVFYNLRNRWLDLSIQYI